VPKNCHGSNNLESYSEDGRRIKRTRQTIARDQLLARGGAAEAARGIHEEQVRNPCRTSGPE